MSRVCLLCSVGGEEGVAGRGGRRGAVERGRGGGGRGLKMR